MFDRDRLFHIKKIPILYPTLIKTWIQKEFSVSRDYSLDNKSQGRQSLGSQKHGPESDTDSMAEYGDGDTGKMFSVDSLFVFT